MATQHFEVIIVGAGIWGLSAAKTFLQINSSLSLLIVDSKATLGGVWAKEQLYDGLRTNNLQGYYEFSDLPMLEADVGVKKQGIITGDAVHSYLQKAAEHFNLTPRIRLSTNVLAATERDDESGWTLNLQDNSTLSCSKLIVATGQASTPYKPSFANFSSFGKPIIHSVDLGKHVESLLENDSVRNVTVLGGSKSAHDAVYLFATAGKSVSWIIHPASRGRGTMPMVVPYLNIGPWTVWLENLFMLRPLTWLGPAPWSDGDGFGWIRWFLHSTWVGNQVVKAVFANLGFRAAQATGILKDSEKTNDLFPGASMMWYGTQSNVLMYDTDFYDLIRSGEVKVTLGHVESLETGRVCLDDGKKIESDVLITATGYDWSATVPLEPANKRLSWGCPVDPSSDNIYPSLDAQSDKEIFARYPILKESPVKPERLPALTGWRCWRAIAPPNQVSKGSKRNLVFLNTITGYQTFMRSEITSLWAYAYLYDRLSITTPTQEEAMKEVSLWTRFGKWRVPFGLQGKLTDFLLDSLPYYDLLLRDLGLRSWRKGGWLREVFGGAYETGDYEGIVDEWVATQGDLRRSEKKNE